MNNQDKTKEQLMQELELLRQRISVIEKSKDNQIAFLTESSFDVVFLITKTGKLKYVSPSVKNVLGYETKQMIGTSFTKYVPKENLSEYWEIIKRIFIEKKISQFETYIKHCNGNLVPVEFAGQIVEIDGELMAQGAMRDITERKRVEEILRKERDFSQNLIDTAQVIILTLDVEAKIIDFNKYMEEISGYRIEEVKGKDWFTTFLPRGEHDQIKTLFKKAISGIQTKGNINYIITKDGKQRFISWYDKTLKNKNGEIISLTSIGQDVTESRKMMEELQESEHKYKSLFEYANDVVFLMDVTEEYGARFLDCNDRTLKLFGCTHRDQIIGKSPVVFSPPMQPDGQPSEEKVRKVSGDAIEGHPQFFEWLHFRLNDKQPFWVEVSLNRIKLKDKFFMQAIMRDITERKKTEAELLNISRFPSENPSPVLRTTNEGKILYANEAGLILLDWWGCKMGDIVPEKWFNWIQEVFRSRKSIIAEEAVEERVFSCVIAPVHNTGDINVYGHDITLRVKAEKRRMLGVQIIKKFNDISESKELVKEILALIKNFVGIESVGIRLKQGEDFPYYVTEGFSAEFIEKENCLCARNKQGKIIRNPDGSSMLECMCGNVISNRTDPTLPFFTEGGSFWTNSTSELLASTTDKDRQSPIPTRNRCNSQGYESVALIPIYSGSKENIGLLQLNDKQKGKFTPDIIKFFEEICTSLGIAFMRKKAEDALKDAYKQLKDAQEELIQSGKMAAMGQLAAGISHELNQPLTGIKGFAQAALMDIEDDNPLREDLDKIVHQADRMDKIIRNVRFFARRSEFVLKEIDINQPIEDSLALLKEQLRIHDICIERRLEKNLPKIQADPNQLQQVFLNIITNARDAICAVGQPDTRGGTLQIETRLSQNKEAIEIIFKDTGCGMSQDQLDHIFNPFFTTKSPDGGIGLGMSIVYRIVENHKGKIEVDSVQGQWTSFKITLPLNVALEEISS